MKIEPRESYVRPLSETWETDAGPGICDWKSSAEIVEKFENEELGKNWSSYATGHFSYLADDGDSRSRTRQILKGAGLGAAILGCLIGVASQSPSAALTGAAIGAGLGGTMGGVSYEPREKVSGTLAGRRNDSGELEVMFFKPGIAVDVIALAEAPQMKPGDNPEVFWNKER